MMRRCGLTSSKGPRGSRFAMSTTPPPLPDVPYVRDILDQPRALTATIAGLADWRTSKALSERLERPEARVVLTGMGASLAALVPLHLRWVGQGRNVFLVETSELLHSQPALLASADILVVVSQSGASAETVRLLERVPSSARLLGVTNTGDSPLAEAAGDLLLTRAGPETTVSCKTYLCTVAALDRLAVAVDGGSGERWAGTGRQAATAIAGYLEEGAAQVAGLVALTSGVRHLFLAGRGPSLAAVQCGALICKEASGVGVEGMSSAAFRHGPYEMSGPSTLVLVAEGEGVLAALNRRLIDDVRRVGGRAEGIGWEAERIRLPSVPAGWLAWVEVLPFQMLSIALATREGREPGRFERATKVTTVE